MNVLYYQLDHRSFGLFLDSTVCVTIGISPNITGKTIEVFSKSDRQIHSVISKFVVSFGRIIIPNNGFFQDEKDIDERVQIEGQLLENVLSKREQKLYFESLNAPKKHL